MTQPNKFEDLNDRFTSLETGMTHSNKFRDRWRTYSKSYVPTKGKTTNKLERMGNIGNR